MFDIHCHILPELDDGAQSMEEAVKMARRAMETGVTDIAATPHFRGDRASFEMLPLIEARLKEFRTVLTGEGIDVNVHSGAEVLCIPETPYLPRELELPCIGNSNYVLLEFYFDETDYYMSDSLAAVAERGYRPIIAHPERYDAVQKDVRILIRWFREGYILQLNKGSVLGTLGRRAESVAEFMLENGLAHVIASDAHSSERRTTDMKGLSRYLEDYVDAEYADILVRRNPRRILNGRRVVPIG